MSSQAKVIPIVPAKSGTEGSDTGELVSLYEKQKKIYPRAVHGWFAAGKRAGSSTTRPTSRR